MARRRSKTRGGITPLRNEYDDSGRLVAHIDAHGNRIEYTHNIEGKQEIVRDRLEHQTVYVYDDEGRVLAKTDPLGKTTSYTYDSKGNVLTETDLSLPKIPSGMKKVVVIVLEW